MNLVKLITEQFSDETLGKLGALMGTDSENAGAAATAAVPTLLSGLAGMASRGEGAKRLSEVLGGIDAGTMGNFAQLLGGDAGGLLQRGNGLLGALFGDGLISGAANAISRYTGISVESARKLLAALLPMVLGKVAAQWRSQGGTVSALTGLFADQKRNIADAVPAGFSLAEVPDLAGTGETVRTATAHATRRAEETAAAASGSMASWLLPLAVLIVGGFLLWNFLKPRAAEGPVAERSARNAETTVMKPVVPDAQAANREMGLADATQFGDNVKSILTSLTTELGAIKDASSAEAAIPKLEELKAKIDTARTVWARIPEANQSAVREIIATQMEPLRQKAETTLALPGLGERIKTLINDILVRLTEMAKQPAANQPAMPK